MWKLLALLMCLPALNGWFDREPEIKSPSFLSTMAQTQTGATQGSARVRVGLVRINNKTKGSLSTDELRERLASGINSSGVEAVTLNASSLSEAQIEAKAKQCDYILLTDISTLKSPSAGKIIGNILSQAARVNTGVSTKSEARLDFRLFPTGSSSATIESSATVKEDTKEAALSAALNQEAKAVVATVKPATQAQQIVAPSGQEVSQAQRPTATPSAGGDAATTDASPRQGDNQGASVDGRWLLGGHPLAYGLTLKTEGTKLTGTRETKGGTHQISGEAHGNNISFSHTVNRVTNTYKGTVSGDELKLTGIEGPEGYRRTVQLIYKRVKEQVPSTFDVAQRPPATPSMGERSATSAAASPMQGANQATSVSELQAELAKDPRLEQLPPEVRQAVLQESGGVEYCNGNHTLGNLYDCSCFARKMFDARLKSDPKVSRVLKTRGYALHPRFDNLLLDLVRTDTPLSECASPSKVAKYGYDRSYQTLAGQQLSDERRKKISECVGASVETSFKARPIADIGYVDRLFTGALTACRER